MRCFTSWPVHHLQADVKGVMLREQTPHLLPIDVEGCDDRTAAAYSGEVSVGAVDERALRRWCKRELHALDLHPPLRVEVLCQRLGTRRGRPIRLVAHPLSIPGPFGVWIGTRSADYILYQSQTTRLHQYHIILHEVGHIIAGHQHDDTADQHWQQMMPDISPEIIWRALQRTHYETAQEREAELLATMIMNIMGWMPITDYTGPGILGNPVVERIQATLGDR